jgi:hypothetical protein
MKHSGERNGIVRKAGSLPGRFGRDENGAVMVITLIVLLLLVKVAMSTYNVGVLTAQKVRLQTVADASAYSSAVWQARFLNYCAYTRRAMIANAANMNTMSASVTNARGIDLHYYDSDDEERYRWSPLGMVVAPCEFLQNLDFEEILGDNFFSDFLGDVIQEIVNPAVALACDLVESIVQLLDFKIKDKESTQGLPRMASTVHNTLYKAITPIQVPSISSAEHLNYMLGESQKAMYFYVSQPWFTVAQEVVQVANGSDTEGYTPVKIEVSKSYELWGTKTLLVENKGLLNQSFLDEKNLSDLEEDIALRTDAFTRAQAFTPAALLKSIPGFSGDGAEFLDVILSVLSTELPMLRSLPFFASRPYWGFDLVFLSEYNGSGFPAGKPKVIYLNVGAQEVSTSFEEDNPSITAMDGFRRTNSENGRPSALSMQYFGWIYIPLPKLEKIRVPLIFFFSGAPEIESYTYDYVHANEDINFYDLAEDLKPEEYEPSVYVALSIDREEFVGKDGDGRGILFNNALMPIAESTRTMHAVSRAKVFFQPRYEERGMEFYKPNLYYPYWEAQLAPFWGESFENATPTIRKNGTELMALILAEILLEEQELGVLQENGVDRSIRFALDAREIRH